MVKLVLRFVNQAGKVEFSLLVIVLSCKGQAFSAKLGKLSQKVWLGDLINPSPNHIAKAWNDARNGQTLPRAFIPIAQVVMDGPGLSV